MAHAPAAVVLTFTEEPDPKLSVVHVLDPSGRRVETGPPAAVAGKPGSLSSPLGKVSNGAFTVSWRVVSRLDGHFTAGTFSFGVGVPARPGAGQASREPSPSAWAILWRWTFYCGLILMLGAGWMAAAGYPDPPRRVAGLVPLGSAAALAGLAGMTGTQLAAGGLGAGKLLGTSLGRAFLWRALPLALGTAGSAAALAPGRPRRGGLVLAASGAAGAMLAHSFFGHAGSGSLRWGKVAVAWIHFGAVGIWIGGLAALIAGLGKAPPAGRALAARRFSAVAGVALGAVLVTGVLRALSEVGSWRALWSTEPGQLTVLKSGLLLALAGLGALNRFRNAGRAGDSPAGLLRIGSVELGVAAGALAATALLSSVAPARFAAAAATSPLIAGGSDYGSTLRARLEITPGLPGFNTFRLQLYDYDTRAAVIPGLASLRFAPAGRPGIAPSRLDLEPAGGAFEASGANLSLTGDWEVTALVQRGADAVEIPIRLRTRQPPRVVHESRAPGQPTLYTTDLPGGRSLQQYLDPARPGRAQFHSTFFDSSGAELPVDDVEILATAPGGSALQVPLVRFSAGHVAANVTLTSGRWRFALKGTDRLGENLDSTLAITVP